MLPAIFAHSQIAGIGDFWSGMLHPLISPAHLIILIGFGLYLGQQAPRGTAASVASFGLALAAGLAVTTAGRIPAINQPVLLSVAMSAALLIVTERGLPAAASAVLFGLAGLLVGLDSATENAALGTAIKMAIGTWLCSCLVTFNVALYTSWLTKAWQRIGIRVAGSWVLAIAMLVIAFALKR
jgi:urease accessory protein